jgi:hypothetical protein
MRLVSWTSIRTLLLAGLEVRDGRRDCPAVVEADEALGLEVLYRASRLCSVPSGMLIMDGGADVEESGG